jgi:L-seryl-tRNA(Ser) seleniumtransferase
MSKQQFLKMLPSVEKLLEDKRIAGRMTLLSRKGITLIVRREIERFRARLKEDSCGYSDEGALAEDITKAVIAHIDRFSGDRLRRVINASGVVLHTNLGRAILGQKVCSAIMMAASGYSDLEVDMNSGQRVSRGRRVEALFSALTGAPATLVVNNNAAAVLLAVNTFADPGGVAVSRGELVEIGGSFRLPEILSTAAAKVIEVGTTNKTRLDDYERAIHDGATLLLKVHTSNYRIVGYTDEVGLAELAELGKKHGVPVMYDQGSGILYPLHTEGIEGEDCLEDILGTGVDIVSFSADKVLGATQGGVILGPEELIGKMRGNHLSRALRVDKLTLAGLEQTLVHYWLGEFDDIPALGMITPARRSIGERARAFAQELGKAIPEGCDIETADGESSIGGGSFPINPLQTVLVVINLLPGRAPKLVTALRKGNPAVLVRIKGDAIYIDLRTVAVQEEKILLEKLKEGIGSIPGRE